MTFRLEQRQPSQEAVAPGQMSAPSLLTTGQTSIRITLAADPDDGGSPITDYDIRWQPSGGSWTEVSSITSPYDLTGLTASTTYEVQARAVNAVGDGAWSETASQATLSPPGAVTIENISFDDDSDLWGVTTTSPNSGNWHWALVTDGGTAPTPDGSGGWSGTTLETDTIAVGAPVDPIDILETGITGVTYDLYLYQRVGTEDSNVITVKFVSDNTAPVITDVIAASNTEIKVTVTTDEGNGTIYSVATNSATVPTQAQIEAGQDHTGADALSSKSRAVTASGEQDPLILAGLTNSTLYHVHTIHSDAHRNGSNIESGTATPVASVGPQASFIWAVTSESTDQIQTLRLDHEDLVEGDTIIVALWVASQSQDITGVSLEGVAGTLLQQSTAINSIGKCQYWEIVLNAAAAGNAAALLALTRTASGMTVAPAVYRVAGTIAGSAINSSYETDGDANFTVSTGAGSVIAAGKAYDDSAPTWTAGATDDALVPAFSSIRFASDTTTLTESRTMTFEQSDLTGGATGVALAIT